MCCVRSVQCSLGGGGLTVVATTWELPPPGRLRHAGDVPVLTGGARPPGPPRPESFTVIEADTPHLVDAYRRVRRAVFVGEQQLFDTSDSDGADGDPRTVVLVALGPAGDVLGGVRLGPVGPGADTGWWTGSRLAVRPAARRTGGVGAALVQAACARAETAGAVRFEAAVQPRNEILFTRIGWERVRDTAVAGREHVLMRWPLRRVADLVAATKAPLAGLLAGLDLGGPGWVGDDGVPVPGTDVVAACDAILPSLVERDPEWAGWCGVLANLNDLAAMGATPTGLLDAVGARDASFATRILRGVRDAADAWGVPVLGGHTQLGVPAALSLTAVGRTRDPVPAGGGRPGHPVTVTADLGGGWRPGHRGTQWDSTTGRGTAQLQAMGSFVQRSRPASAKDVSMAGIVGTLGMLAEASGCAAVLDVGAVPTPRGAATGDWLTCLPGFVTVSTAPASWRPLPAGPAVSAVCGELTAGRGVSLRWPDGEVVPVVRDTVTGLGVA